MVQISFVRLLSYWKSIKTYKKQPLQLNIRKCLIGQYLEILRSAVPAEVPVNPVTFKKMEVTSPLPDTKSAVVLRLSNATLEIHEGISHQQTIQAVLLALQNVCQVISRLQRTFTQPVATQICVSPLMGLQQLFSNSFKWILFNRHCFFSVGNGVTGSKHCSGKATDLSCSTNVWKMESSAGPVMKVM